MSFAKAVLISITIFTIFTFFTIGYPVLADYLSELSEEPIEIYENNIETMTTIAEATKTLAFHEPYGSFDDFDFKMPDDTGRTQEKTYKWEYRTYECSIYTTYDTDIYDFYSNRNRDRDYSSFITDPYDDKLIESIANSLDNLTMTMELPDSEIPYLAISFVQALPYTSDSISSGYDEYPRFPYETLYLGGGDCEDTAILSAAILRELGYDVVFITLPSHAAIGIKGSDDISGSYYTYNNENYYYLETTNTGWNVGAIPEEYQSEDAQILPIYEKTELFTTFDATVRSNGNADYVDVTVTVTNVGSLEANNVEIYVALQTLDENTVYAHITSEELPKLPTDIPITYEVTDLKVNSDELYRILVQARGDNVVSDPSYSEWR
ncbi:hypothetical protein [Methanococcoides alaskense]|uniref:Transglutaminase-like domain-containing protein n=1 Tax=Methanococcoides alaskense TaxID=325778 RepID=A0AA90TXM3_9EURY|nr:hypothetical protein [Methanococcoides alaskense]MDA0525151.1 hypothetical protein [Methanococcoides alaskense]MDR6221928.1 hypothetical protein [Methanococcoides alaskense]